MSVAKGRGAEALVALRIFLVADPHLGLVYEPDDGGDDGRPIGRLALQILGDFPAKLWKRRAELRQPVIFDSLSLGPEIGVIAILPASARVIADRLNMAFRLRTEP